MNRVVRNSLPLGVLAIALMASLGILSGPACLPLASFWMLASSSVCDTGSNSDWLVCLMFLRMRWTASVARKGVGALEGDAFELMIPCHIACTSVLTVSGWEEIGKGKEGLVWVVLTSVDVSCWLAYTLSGSVRLKNWVGLLEFLISQMSSTL